MDFNKGMLGYLFQRNKQTLRKKQATKKKDRRTPPPQKKKHLYQKWGLWTKRKKWNVERENKSKTRKENRKGRE